MPPFLKESIFSFPLSALLLFMTTHCATHEGSLFSSNSNMEAGSPAPRRAASMAMDSFPLEHRVPPPRNSQKWEFFYKNCVLVGRNPYPERSTYSCNEPEPLE